MVDFTVAIPTYNSEHRLPQVLERLRSQINTESFIWEVIVVDNNSRDNTKKIVQDYQANWSEIFPLRYCFEGQQGVVFARQLAMKEAKGDFVGFLDDDNYPAPNWVAEAYAFGKLYSKAGAYGGQIHANFEVEPPQNFERIQSFLAIKNCGSKPILYKPDTLSLPAGSGLVVRKKAWDESVPSHFIPTQRGGDDFEISLHMHRAGWEIWYNPAMHIHHQIPAWRLERKYLIYLAHVYGLCICPLRMINARGWQKPVIIARMLIGNLRRIIRHIIKYKMQIRTDLVAACEMEFFLSSFLSPFYYLLKRTKH